LSLVETERRFAVWLFLIHWLIDNFINSLGFHVLKEVPRAALFYKHAFIARI
jgi:hypothetical protein